MTDSAPAPEQDRAAVRFPPPLIYVGALIAGWAIDKWLWPSRLDRWFDYSWSIPIGSALGVAGFVLAVLALGLFRRTGQKPEPWTPTPEIITDGAYRYTRNPMYVAMAMIQLGTGIAVLNPWMVALVPAAMWLAFLIAVRHEEAYLEHKFGDLYRRYRARVRRWL